MVVSAKGLAPIQEAAAGIQSCSEQIRALFLILVSLSLLFVFAECIPNGLNVTGRDAAIVFEAGRYEVLFVCLESLPLPFTKIGSVALSNPVEHAADADTENVLVHLYVDSSFDFEGPQQPPWPILLFLLV